MKKFLIALIVLTIMGFSGLNAAKVQNPLAIFPWPKIIIKYKDNPNRDGYLYTSEYHSSNGFLHTMNCSQPGDEDCDFSINPFGLYSRDFYNIMDEYASQQIGQNVNSGNYVNNFYLEGDNYSRSVTWSFNSSTSMYEITINIDKLP